MHTLAVRLRTVRAGEPVPGPVAQGGVEHVRTAAGSVIRQDPVDGDAVGGEERGGAAQERGRGEAFSSARDSVNASRVWASTACVRHTP